MNTILLTLGELGGGTPVSLLLVALLIKVGGIMVLSAYFSGHHPHHCGGWCRRSFHREVTK